jgi:hypothetical protein
LTWAEEVWAFGYGVCFQECIEGCGVALKLTKKTYQLFTKIVAMVGNIKLAGLSDDIMRRRPVLFDALEFFSTRFLVEMWKKSWDMLISVLVNSRLEWMLDFTKERGCVSVS